METESSKPKEPVLYRREIKVRLYLSVDEKLDEIFASRIWRPRFDQEVKDGET